MRIAKAQITITNRSGKTRTFHSPEAIDEELFNRIVNLMRMFEQTLNIKWAAQFGDDPILMSNNQEVRCDNN